MERIFEEVAEEIFLFRIVPYLELFEIAALELTSKKILSIISNPEMWKNILFIRYKHRNQVELEFSINKFEKVLQILFQELIEEKKWKKVLELVIRTSKLFIGHHRLIYYAVYGMKHLKFPNFKAFEMMIEEIKKPRYFFGKDVCLLSLLQLSLFRKFLRGKVFGMKDSIDEEEDNLILSFVRECKQSLLNTFELHLDEKVEVNEKVFTMIFPYLSNKRVLGYIKSCTCRKFRDLFEVVEKFTSVEIEFNNGVYYGKQFKGKRDGWGSYKFKNGDCYRGMYRNGEKNGHGEFFWKDGSKYFGEFKNNMKNGKGKFLYENGNVYYGEYVDDKMCGNGVFSYKDGSKFEGKFVNDLRNGFGTFFYVNGVIYKGEYKDDRCHGKGKLTLPDCCYIGEFKEDNREGNATVIYKNGDRFEGIYDNDRRSVGKMYCEKWVFDGKWEIANNVQNRRGEYDFDGKVECRENGEIFYQIKCKNGEVEPSGLLGKVNFVGSKIFVKEKKINF